MCDGSDALHDHSCTTAVQYNPPINDLFQSLISWICAVGRHTILLDTVIVTTARTTQRANVGGAENPVISNCTCAWDIPSWLLQQGDRTCDLRDAVAQQCVCCCCFQESATLQHAHKSAICKRLKSKRQKSPKGCSPIFLVHSWVVLAPLSTVLARCVAFLC